MKKILLTISLLTFLFYSCNTGGNTTLDKERISDKVSYFKTPKMGTVVSTPKELQSAIANAKPGTTILLKDGIWKDLKIDFNSTGTKEKPIVLAAQTSGKVFLEGESYLKIGGSHLIVSGLYFQNGHTTSNAVIDFKKSKTQVANYCRVTNCVIKDYNSPKRDTRDHWVEFWGRHNQMDHCYLSGKSNVGPTVRVDIKGNRNIKNYHKIVHNHFGPRPRKGGPKGETIQLGDSYCSMSPSNTFVGYNLFEACNGEVEVISSKTNFNVFKSNVFYKSEGSLVTRHGNYCKIEGNYFIGDGQNPHYGGIRLINTGHTVTNNYFLNMIGENFRAPLAVMNGIPKSPLNRYNQVTDVTVCYNTWVNCKSPLQFGVGTNISQKDVLPSSEIRSAVPIRTEVINNIVYNEKGDPNPIIAHDKIDKILFKNNVINNTEMPFNQIKGFSTKDLNLFELDKQLQLPIADKETKIYKTFGLEEYNKDLFNMDRSEENNRIGAVVEIPKINPDILNFEKYGPNWFNANHESSSSKTYKVQDSKELKLVIDSAKSGDVIELTSSNYTIDQSIIIDKKISIRSHSKPATLSYTGMIGTPLFEMNPKGELLLDNLIIKGNRDNFAFASRKDMMSSLYNLEVKNSEISNFDYILKAYKESFADHISFENTRFKDCHNGVELSEEKNDKGDYNVGFLTFDKCKFYNIEKNVIDYYRGGYDESTIGGTLVVKECYFSKCGAKEENKILLNHYGIINVTLSGNTFKDNPVKLVAVLWGAKNNVAYNNSFKNSGKIIVQENLKLTLVY